MAIDMKQKIAEAAASLLFVKKVKRLTVKDIVEECNITRQAFYYHFEDISELLKWMFEKNSDKLVQECLAQKDAESSLRHLLSIAISMRPYVKRSVKSNYGEEIEQLLKDFITGFFRKIIEEKEMYQGYSPVEKQLILRYHSHAIFGILWEWTKEDSENMELIVHQICLILQGEVHPF